MTFVVAAFYHFFEFPHFAEKQADILHVLKEEDVKGSILIAAEGFNGTVAGTRQAIDCLLAYLESDIACGPFEHKESYAATQPFKRAKVRLKKETISLGEAAPLEARGEYVDPAQWNALIADPDTIVIDTRNDYEVHFGTFDNAINPGIDNFKQLPAFTRQHFADAKQKKIATFCTGGIRCEKYTAWLKAEGFEQVYHLRGGILKYLETVPPEQSTWRGECFVFDDRIAVGHGLVPSSTADICRRCDHSLTAEDKKQMTGENCPYCIKG